MFGALWPSKWRSRRASNRSSDERSKGNAGTLPVFFHLS